MKVCKEIDALETMAIAPVQFLVKASFAMVVMLPCLTIWANFMGIIMVVRCLVFLPRILPLGATSKLLWNRSICATLMTGLIKSLMFGITIAAVGCYEGLATSGGAEQVAVDHAGWVTSHLSRHCCGCYFHGYLFLLESAVKTGSSNGAKQHSERRRR